VADDNRRLAALLQRRLEGRQVVGGIAVQLELEFLPGEQLQPPIKALRQPGDEGRELLVRLKGTPLGLAARVVDLQADLRWISERVADNERPEVVEGDAGSLLGLRELLRVDNTGSIVATQCRQRFSRKASARAPAARRPGSRLISRRTARTGSERATCTAPASVGMSK
jgi:hypothetical protein